MTVCTVYVFGRYFYRIQQVPNKLVHNKFFFIVFAQFKSVIEENVSCKRSNIWKLHYALKGVVVHTALPDYTVS